MANGFLPCGLVYSALSIPVALAAPVPGALAMVAFGAGTLPVLPIAAVGLRRFAPSGHAGRRVGAALVIAAGLWSMGVRAGILNRSQAGPPATHLAQLTRLSYVRLHERTLGSG